MLVKIVLKTSTGAGFWYTIATQDMAMFSRYFYFPDVETIVVYQTYSPHNHNFVFDH